MAAAGLSKRTSDKLRDVDEKYSENGHVFLFNQELLCSFDICGGCEAHAMLLQLKPSLVAAPAAYPRKSLKRYRKLVARCQNRQYVQGVNKTAPGDSEYCGINQLLTLRDLIHSGSTLTANNVNFVKCPSNFPR